MVATVQTPKAEESASIKTAVGSMTADTWAEELNRDGLVIDKRAIVRVSEVREITPPPPGPTASTSAAPASDATLPGPPPAIEAPAPRENGSGGFFPPMWSWWTGGGLLVAGAAAVFMVSCAGRVASHYTYHMLAPTRLLLPHRLRTAMDDSDV